MVFSDGSAAIEGVYSEQQCIWVIAPLYADQVSTLYVAVKLYSNRGEVDREGGEGGGGGEGLVALVVGLVVVVEGVLEE